MSLLEQDYTHEESVGDTILKSTKRDDLSRTILLGTQFISCLKYRRGQGRLDAGRLHLTSPVSVACVFVAEIEARHARLRLYAVLSRASIVPSFTD